jgi:hemerythrin-like domain-containing protein
MEGDDTMIDVLINEHVYIKIVLKAVKKVSVDLMNGGEVDDELYRNIIDFVRNFADKYHHQKEENYLFNRMSESPKNNAAAHAPIQGMLLEHDIGRKYISNLEKALNDYKSGNKDSKVNIISYGIVYTDLLEDHIFKEDNVIFQYALRVIDEDEAKFLEKEFNNIEEDVENTKIRKKYIEFAEDLKNKFNL